VLFTNTAQSSKWLAGVPTRLQVCGSAKAQPVASSSEKSVVCLKISIGNRTAVNVLATSRNIAGMHRLGTSGVRI